MIIVDHVFEISLVLREVTESFDTIRVGEVHDVSTCP